MAQQTAVEWFCNNIDDIIPDGLRERVDLLKNEAKEMEKQQIIDAYIDAEGILSESDFKAKQYYTKTYGK
jgi:hypothetical protein